MSKNNSESFIKNSQNQVISINNIIWSKGCNEGDYKHLGTEHTCSEKYIKDLINMFNIKNVGYNTLWIRNTSINDKETDLDIVAKKLHIINKPFILVTSDGDRPVPSSYNINTVQRILNSEKVIFWFTQNYDRTIVNNKLKYMPIGLDLHTSIWFINNSNISKLDYICNTRLENIKREKIKNKILCDAHLSYSHIERKYLCDTLKENPNIYFLQNHICFKDITELYNNYHFVLSPRGNGLDCHRTWEIFLAGGIVITKTTPLDNMFIDNNLPVVILSEWDELNENLEEKLKIWYDKYYPLTSIENIYPKMTFNYWLKT